MLAVNLSTIANDPRQLAFGRLSYDVPVGTDGAQLGASMLYSEVRPGDIRRLYNDVTTTESFEIRGSIVPLQTQKSTLTLTGALAFTNVTEKDVFGAFYMDHIRTIRLTADYRLQDNFGGTNYLTATWRQGLDVFGASRGDDVFVSRYGVSSTFSVLNLGFTRYQTLSDAWSVKLSGAGQLASGPLFTSQQFYLGGAAFGRGYGSAEISGDNAMAGSLELRFDQKLTFKYLTGYQLYGFVDAGTAWNYGYKLYRWPCAHLRRSRRAVLPGRRSAGRHRGGRAIELSRARQHDPQCTCAVFAVELLQALSGTSAGALPVSRPDDRRVRSDSSHRSRRPWPEPPVPDNLSLC